MQDMIGEQELDIVERQENVRGDDFPPPDDWVVKVTPNAEIKIQIKALGLACHYYVAPKQSYFRYHI